MTGKGRAPAAPKADEPAAVVEPPKADANAAEAKPADGSGELLLDDVLIGKVEPKAADAVPAAASDAEVDLNDLVAADPKKAESDLAKAIAELPASASDPVAIDPANDVNAELAAAQDQLSGVTVTEPAPAVSATPIVVAGLAGDGGSPDTAFSPTRSPNSTRKAPASPMTSSRARRCISVAT